MSSKWTLREWSAAREAVDHLPGGSFVRCDACEGAGEEWKEGYFESFLPDGGNDNWDNESQIPGLDHAGSVERCGRCFGSGVVPAAPGLPSDDGVLYLRRLVRMPLADWAPVDREGARSYLIEAGLSEQEITEADAEGPLGDESLDPVREQLVVLEERLEAVHRKLVYAGLLRQDREDLDLPDPI